MWHCRSDLKISWTHGNKVWKVLLTPPPPPPFIATHRSISACILFIGGFGNIMIIQQCLKWYMYMCKFFLHIWRTKPVHCPKFLIQDKSLIKNYNWRTVSLICDRRRQDPKWNASHKRSFVFIYARCQRVSGLVNF